MSNAMDSLVTSIYRNRLAHGRECISTPWGPSQSVERIADGIDFVSTAGHGGYRLSEARQAVARARFPEFRPFTGSWQWLEEDCDAALAPILFPDCFPAASVERATKFVSSYLPYFKACAGA